MLEERARKIKSKRESGKEREFLLPSGMKKLRVKKRMREPACAPRRQAHTQNDESLIKVNELTEPPD